MIGCLPSASRRLCRFTLGRVWLDTTYHFTCVVSAVSPECHISSRSQSWMLLTDFPGLANSSLRITSWPSSYMKSKLVGFSACSNMGG